MNVFERLVDLILPPRENERALRSTTVLDATAPVAIFLPSLTVTALLPYRGLTKAAILESKYHDNKHAQALLGEVLADYLKQQVSQPCILVPLPLSGKRYAKRGYNQVERVCDYAIQRLKGVGVMRDALRRVRDTTPQTTLTGTERRTNMKDAFRASALDSSYTYILVDDVITTGATLEAACVAMKEAGGTVIALTLAR